MLLAATLLAALDLFGVSLQHPGELVAPPAASTVLVRDGGRFIAVERSSIDPQRVHLRWDDGRAALASVGRVAIVALPAGDLAAALASRDLVLVAPIFERAGLYRVRSARPLEDGLAVAARLAGDGIDIFPDFAFARRTARIEVPPDDPRHPGQWYLETIDIHDAWAIETGDASVVIGVVDDGCDLAHPDLAAHMEPGRDLVDDDDDPSFAPELSGNEHGTACAGLVAAVGDNGIGIAGTCPECHLRCVRLLPGGVGGEVPIGNDIIAYDQQLAWGVAVSSNSWGFIDHFPVPNLLARAISTLIAEGRGGLGTVVVFAVGNDAREVKNDELYGIEGVVTIGAINAFDELASFSNSGDPLDLVAPAGTLTTDISGRDGADDGDYTGLFGGTSSACPVAAGVAALLVAANPDKTALEIERAMIASARPAPFAVPDANGHDALYGYGIVDPTAALELLAPPAQPEVSPEATPEPAPEAAPEVPTEPVEATAEASELTRTSEDGCQGGRAPGLVGVFLLLLIVRQRAAESTPSRAAR